MKHIFNIYFLTGILILISCKDEKKSGNFLPCDSTKNYVLLWDEEFNYSGLPDSSTWGYETGFIRNDEKQYYTRNRPENARVENGLLVIESRKESYQGAAYTSASINTFGKVSFPVNTRTEVCARLPYGKGIWPAIWTMGTDIQQIGWPRCGEIDIMEFVGHTPNTIWGTFHWWNTLKPDSSLHLQEGDTIHFTDLHHNFHVYGVERTAKTLSFFVDNHYYFHYDTDSTVETSLLSKPYYLLLNTAIGGSWGGEIDTAIFPQKFYIDWVRVFKIPEQGQQ